MARRPGELAGRAVEQDQSVAKRELATRRDDLLALLDQCVTARAKAEALGEKFVAYLLAMAIEETRIAHSASQAQSVPTQSGTIQS